MNTNTQARGESASDFASYQIRPREDGRGPYNWRYVVASHNGLRQGSIYRKFGSELSAEQVKQLRGICDEQGFDMRRAK